MSALTGFLTFVAIAVAIIFIVVFIYLLFVKFKGRDDPYDTAWALIIGNQYTNGHALGRSRVYDVGEKRTKIEISQRDINLSRLENDKEYKIKKLSPIFFDNHQVEELPISKHEKFIVCLPSNSEEFPKDLLRTRFGKALYITMFKNNKEKDEENLHNARISAIKEIALDRVGEGIVKEAISKSKEVIKDISETTKSEEKFSKNKK